MEKKDFKQLIQPFTSIDTIVMVLMALVVLYINKWLGIACIAVVVGVTIYHASIASVKTNRVLENIKSQVAEKNDEITRDFIESCPVHMCISDITGKVFWSNEGFREKISAEESIDDILNPEELQKLFDINQYEIIKAIKDSKFRISASTKDESSHSRRMIYFEDVTSSEIVKELFKNNRPAFMHVNIDNYDELIAASPVEKQSKIVADIESILRGWVAESNGSITRIKSNQFAVVCTQKSLEEARANGFKIMEKIHEVETEADFPTTISIGIGIEAANYEDLQLSAYQALDLALGRGGDQVVIKKSGNDIEYYGGSLANIERRNKGKSRIMAHALLQLIKDSDKVLVMGHQRPDLDSFGSSIGVASLALAANKKAYIVLNAPNEGIDIAYDAALKTEKFEFINNEMALALAQQETQLVIVDTHIGPRVECPALLEKCKKLVVIDHHRKSANAIENTLLTYMEPFASSASEQVCEMLQYAGGNLEFGKFEMDALLSGITLDTKNFTQNTGARTFESASWLRRHGADTKKVRDFFKMRLDFFQKKVNMIASAEILANGIAVAYTKETDSSMQVLAAQAADELLEMRGIEAVFVAGALEDGKTTVSARSNGKLNVQVIMEKLGGGGHINIAAAQTQDGPEIAIQNVVKLLREEKLI